MIRRILMTGDTVGGVWTYTMELAEALAAHDIQVVLAALGGPPSVEQRVQACRIPTLDLLASDFRLEWMHDPWRDVEASGHWLLDLEEQYAPDLVHLNSYGHGALPWHVPVLVTGHSCVLSWWAAVRGGAPPDCWLRYRREVRRCLKSADAVAAPSQAMAAALAEHYGLDPGRCRVIPNGRSASRFRCAVKEPFIFCAGRLWDEGQNVAALARLSTRLSWPVFLAGPVDQAPSGACIQLGPLGPDALAGWYARAAIYALPARYEPFGLSPLEAALSGCALVLGDIPSLREVWGDTAVFVPPDDAAAQEAALRDLIEHPGRREELARAATRHALEFTPRRMAEGYLDAYRSIAGARRVSSAP